MKRLLVVILLLLVMVGCSWAATPAIDPVQPTYRDDDSTAHMNAIEPNREFLMVYRIVVDTGSSYVVHVKSNLREFVTNPNTLSSGARNVELKLPLELWPNENAEFTIRVTNNNGEGNEHTTSLVATYGEQRIKFDPSAIEIPVGETRTVATLGKSGNDKEYSNINLWMLMVLESLDNKYEIDDPTVASVVTTNEGYAYLHGLKAGTTKLRVSLATQAYNYPTGDIAECTVTVTDKSTPSPTPTPPSGGSGGGGCNTGGWAILPLLLAAIIIGKQR